MVKGLGIGGAERLISEGARYWNRDRFEYHVAYALPWKDQLVARLEREEVPVHCVGAMAPSSLPSFRGIRRLIRDLRPDVVHAHLPIMGILGRLSAGRRLVYTEHNLVSSYHPVTRWANRVTYRRNRAVIAVSAAVAESLFGYRGPQPTVIENAVNSELEPGSENEARAELGIDRSTPLIVQVANMRPGKGHENLLRAAQILQLEVPDIVIVSIGGEKWPGDLDRLTTRAHELGVGATVRFLGRRADALKFVAAADVFVNPAEVEGMPVAVLEAMALGRPIVATAVGGVPDMLADGLGGLLVPSQSPDALAMAVSRLLVDRRLANELGWRAQRIAEKEHGLERMVRRIESVYEEVLANRA